MISQQLRDAKSKVQWCWVSLDQIQETKAIPQPEANTWVQLLELLNPYCHDEALLLCPISDREWVAWIPDHGEAVINIEQFCVPHR